MSVRTAVIVLVVIVALLVAALVVGLSGDEGDSNDSSSIVDRLGELAGDPSAVPRDAITDNCPRNDDDPDLLEIPGGLVGGGCAVVVQQSDTLRLLNIAAVTDLEIEAPAPEGDLDVSDETKAGEQAKVAIGQGEEQTTVELSCPGTGGCQARLVAE